MFLGSMLGIPPIDEHGVDQSGVNLLGYVAFAFAAVAGLWAGLATHAGRPDPSRTLAGRLSYQAWLCGTAAATLADGLVRLAFHAPRDGTVVYAMTAVEILALLAIGRASWVWWRWRMDQLQRLTTPAADTSA